jgi:hypothetical protein
MASFFMDLIEVPSEEVVQEKVQYKNPKTKVVQKHYEIPKIEVSKNIQKFDKKVKVYTENPFSYNAVSLKKDKPNATPNRSAQELLIDPTYNMIGKFLGVDAIHDWNRYSDKVYAITEWAKVKTGKNDLNNLIKWLGGQIKSTPDVGAKKIDSLYIFARMYLNK